MIPDLSANFGDAGSTDIIKCVITERCRFVEGIMKWGLEDLITHVRSIAV